MFKHKVAISLSLWIEWNLFQISPHCLWMLRSKCVAPCYISKFVERMHKSVINLINKEENCNCSLIFFPISNKNVRKTYCFLCEKKMVVKWRNMLSGALLYDWPISNIDSEHFAKVFMWPIKGIFPLKINEFILMYIYIIYYLFKVLESENII